MPPEFDPAAAFLAAMQDQPQPMLPDDLAVETPEFDPAALSQEAFMAAMMPQAPEPVEAIAEPVDPEAALTAQGGELEMDIGVAESLPMVEPLDMPAEGLAPDVVSDPYGQMSIDATTSADQALAPEQVAGLEDQQHYEPPTEEERFAAMSAEELAMDQYNREQDKQKLAEEMRAEYAREADARQLERDAENVEAIETARRQTADIVQRSKDLAAEEIDQGRWWSSRSTGQKIANVIAAMIGGHQGVVSGRGGNDVLDRIDGMIAQDIAIQTQNLKNRTGMLASEQGLVAQELALSGNLYQAQKTAELTMKQGLEHKIAEQMASLDPSGTLYSDLEVKRRGIRGSVAAGVQQASLQTRKFAIENMEIDRAERKQAVLEAKAIAEIAETRAKTAKLTRVRTGPKTGVRKALSVDDQRKFRGMYAPFTVDGLLVPLGGEEAARLRAAAPQDAKGSAETKAAREVDADPLAVRDPRTGDKMKINGKVWRTDKADDIQARMTQTQVIRNVADKIKILKKEYGGSNAWVESDEFQEVQALVSKIDMDNAVALGLGAISKDDLVQLVNYRGGVDPTSYVLDATKGIETMAKSMEDTTNTYMKGKGWKGPVWKPSRTGHAKKLETPISELQSGMETMLPGDTVEGMISGMETSIDVLLKRDDVNRYELTKTAEAINRNEALTHDQRVRLINRMAAKYNKQSSVVEGERLQSERLSDMIGTRQIADPEHEYLRILQGAK